MLSYPQYRQVLWHFRQFLADARARSEQMRAHWAYLEKTKEVDSRDLMNEALRLRERTSVLRRLVHKRLELCRSNSHSRLAGHRLPSGEVIAASAEEQRQTRDMLAKVESDAATVTRQLEIGERALRLGLRRQADKLQGDSMRYGHGAPMPASLGELAEKLELIHTFLHHLEHALELRKELH